MSWFQKILRFFRPGKNPRELARRLGVSLQELENLQPRYQEFRIPKRDGSARRILAPSDDLKRVQRLILRKILARLRAHPAAHGFERKKSFVTNARAHEQQSVVLNLDLKDFFPSISAERVEKYFWRIGWNRRAAKLLTKLCTWDNQLPQGAPTSPRLSNLVNWPLDARLEGLALFNGARYTRYADDITFSFGEDSSSAVRYCIWRIGQILADEGYRINWRKKISLRRQHQRQEVTGLVVNRRAQLPREKRRWLRAVRHRALQAQGGLSERSTLSGGPTLTPSQISGWDGLQKMVSQ